MEIINCKKIYSSALLAITFGSLINGEINVVKADNINPQSLTDLAHNQENHLNVDQGWSNDVQSIVKNPNGYYDIYFLATPNGKGASDHGTTVWKHTTTKDWKNFTPQNIAINVGKGGNSWYGAATGSVIINQGNITGVPKGAEVAFFTGYHDVQSIYAAYSDDNGKTFNHVLNNGNPIINWNSPGASQDKNNFRDADVFYYNNKLFMYTAEGNKFGVYTSSDGLNWHKADPNGESKVLPSTFMKGMSWSDADIPVECPVLKTMQMPNGQNKVVLFYGGKNASLNQTTGTYYVVGHLDNNGLFVADYNAHRLDLGSDFYAANFSGNDNLNNTNNEIISLGWIGNWGYTGNGVYDNQNVHNTVNKNEETEHIGAYSTPRLLKLNNDGTISDNILQNISTIHHAIIVDVDHPSNKDNKPYSIQENDGSKVYNLIDHTNDNVNNVYDLEFETKNEQPYQGRIYIDIWQGKDCIRFNYDPSNGWMQCNQYASELDNDDSGMSASNNYKATKSANTELFNKNNIDLKIITDKDSVEFFFPNGQAYTVERFATQNNQDFKVYTINPDNNNQLVFLDNLTLEPTKINLSSTNNGSGSSAPSSHSHANSANTSNHASSATPTSHTNSATPTSHTSSAISTSHASLANPTSHANLATPTSHASLATPTSHASSATPTSHASSATPTSHASLATPTSHTNSATTISHASSAILTNHANSQTPTSAVSSETLTGKNSSVTPTSQASSVTPDSQASSVTPTSQVSSATTTNQTNSVTPTSQVSSATTTNQTNSVTPTSQVSSAITTSQTSSITPNNQVNSVVSNSQASSVNTSSQSSSASTASQSGSVTTTSQSNSATTVSQSSSATSTSQVGSTTSTSQIGSTTPTSQTSSATLSSQASSATSSSQANSVISINQNNSAINNVNLATNNKTKLADTNYHNNSNQILIASLFGISLTDLIALKFINKKH